MNDSECPNAFKDRVLLNKGQSDTILFITGITLPCILFINLFQGVALYKTRSLNSRCRWYVFMLTISDGMYAVTAMPLLLVLFSKYRETRFCLLEYATVFAIQFNLNVSVYLTALIAYQRYLKINPSLKNLTSTGLRWSLMSGNLANFLVVLCFVLPLAHAIFSTHVFGKTSSPWPNFILKCVDVVIMSTVYFLYFKVCYRVRNRRRQQGDLPMRVIIKDKERSTRSSSYSYEFTKTVLFILVTLVISFLPFLIVDLWTSWFTYVKHRTSPAPVRFFYNVSVTIMPSICFWNALIFIYRSKALKQYLMLQIDELKKLVCFRKKKCWDTQL